MFSTVPILALFFLRSNAIVVSLWVVVWKTWMSHKKITDDCLDEPSLLAGVDEVGRGPLAGAVVAAAVILDPEHPILGLADSKLLSAARRERLYGEILEHCVCYALGRAEVEEIDRINILQASLLAMRRAVLGLTVLPEETWVDGNRCPKVPGKVRAIIKGDQKVPAISAASIIAKVVRDAEMVHYDQRYPGYGFAKHKGYPTKMHVAALQELGVSAIHRRSFGPVKKCLLEKV